jgi:hypothetical protein
MGNELGLDNKDSVFSISSSPGTKESVCPKLSLQQRVIGFVVCSLVGFVISWVLVFVFVFSGFDVKTFAILFSMCQVLNIGASCFLSTPKGHLQARTKKHRVGPSVLSVLRIVLTLVCALATDIKAMGLVCVILLTICYYWYTISFIPCGTTILKKACGCCWDFEDD